MNLDDHIENVSIKKMNWKNLLIGKYSSAIAKRSFLMLSESDNHLHKLTSQDRMIGQHLNSRNQK